VKSTLTRMTRSDSDRLIRRYIAGDPEAAADIAARAPSTSSPDLLVAAALIARAGAGLPGAGLPGAGLQGAELLDRASAAARSTRDRQLVVIAAAHLDGDRDRVGALARDHLVDHPDNALVAWIAATSPSEDNKES
jgi:hypothetical protein